MIKFRVALFGIIAALLLQATLGEQVSALFGVPDRTGYFSGATESGTERFYGSRVWDEGIASHVNTPNEFIAYTEARLTGGDAQQRTGAAFIIMTMLGVNYGSSAKTRNPSAAQINDWRARVRNTNVNWSEWRSYSTNSRYMKRSLGNGAGPNDVEFYPNNGAETSIVFRNSAGAIVYVLKRSCANPVGGGGLPQASNWSSDGFTGIYRANGSGGAQGASLGHNVTARVGERYTFQFSVRNLGPTATDRTVNAYRTYTYPNASANNELFASRGAGVPGGRTNIFSQSAGWTGTITANDLGKSFCMTVRYSPIAHTGGSRTLPRMCVNVPYEYNLIPIVNSPPASVVTPGTSVTFTHSVDNEGPTRSRDTFLAYKTYIFPPGQDVNNIESLGVQNGVTTNNDPRYHPTISAASQQLPNRVFANGPTPVTDAATAIDTSNLAFGTKVCRILAVDPESAANPAGGRWSDPVCVIIGKLPHMQIESGDIWAGGLTRRAVDGTGTPICSTSDFSAERATITGRLTGYSSGDTFGSFGEYGVFALSDISAFGSAYRTKEETNRLHFANTSPPGSGHFHGDPTSPTAESACIDDAYDFYKKPGQPSPPNPSNLNLSSLPSGVYYTSNAVTITGGTLGANKHIVILTDNNVTIDGSIEYQDTSYSSLRAVPSLIIATLGSIYVDKSVDTLDGTYQADDNFFTCRQGFTSQATTLSGLPNTCNEQLSINGSIGAGINVSGSSLSGHFRFNRTYGGGIEADGTDRRREPAERIIMRPEVFLSPYANSSGNGYIRTVSEQELPPRY